MNRSAGLLAVLALSAVVWVACTGVDDRTLTGPVAAVTGAGAAYPSPSPPPNGVCDFVTFGRLVVTINGDTYVISGNAGGNRPGGGILGHVNILNQTENEQVVNARPTSYGVGTIAGPNPRIITAGGVTFQLSDRGEPGRGLDLIRIFGQTLAIERGNIQYHANCRGPGS